MSDPVQSITTLTMVLPVVAAVVASFVGAGGAVLAQHVSARQTAKREDKRLAFEKEQVAEQAKRARAQHFADQKRRAFSEYLRETREATFALDLATMMQRDAIKQIPFFARYNVASEKLRDLETEISLIEPAMGAVVDQLNNSLSAWAQLLEESPESLDRRKTFVHVQKIKRLRDECITTMQDSLGTRTA